MEPLPAGVTGFGLRSPHVNSDFRSFSSACRAAARTIGANVQSTTDAGSSPALGFHEALLVVDRHPLLVLCNASVPVIAFAMPRNDTHELRNEFIDCPQLAAVLCDNYRVLSRQEAHSLPVPEIVSLLEPEELRQLRYWRSERVGDVVFNHWD